jgi:hypothetical protein
VSRAGDSAGLILLVIIVAWSIGWFTIGLALGLAVHR